MQNHAFIKKNRQNGQFATLVVENQVKSSFGKGVALAVAVLALGVCLPLLHAAAGSCKVIRNAAYHHQRNGAAKRRLACG